MRNEPLYWLLIQSRSTAKLEILASSATPPELAAISS